MSYPTDDEQGCGLCDGWGWFINPDSWEPEICPLAGEACPAGRRELRKQRRNGWLMLGGLVGFLALLRLLSWWMGGS